MATWEQSVARARKAQNKSFEAKMEIAAASLEQFGWQGEGTAKEGKTLENFAEDIDVGYTSLRQYRQVYAWLDGKIATRVAISFAMCRLAIDSGRFSNIEELEQLLQEEPPTEDTEGEPCEFKRWTTRALEIWIDSQDTAVADPWPEYDRYVIDAFSKAKTALEITTSKWFGRALDGKRRKRLHKDAESLRGLADQLDELAEAEE